MDYKNYRAVYVEPWQQNPDAKPFSVDFTSVSAEKAHATAQWFADIRGWTLLTVKDKGSS